MEHTNAYAKIKLNNLIDNFKYVHSLNPDKTPICIVKADAYGHGAGECAKALASCGVEYFAVASLDEAIALRDFGIDSHILVLGYIPLDRIEESLKYNIIYSVYSYSFAKRLDEVCKNLNITADVHIKLNTGMNRLGFSPEKADFVNKIKKVHELPCINIKGVFSHYSTADETDLTYSKMQRQIFTDAVEKMQDIGIDFELIHISNSAASLCFDCEISNAYRPGLVLYGISPLPNLEGQEHLKPVMEFMSNVANIFDLPKGADLGYARKYRALYDRKIAVVCVGYADGYPRILSNKSSVYINGYRACVVGNICMDMLMVDITDIDNVKVGDKVELFGDNISACELAELSETIPYEIMCDVNKRVRREYIWDKEM